MNRSVAVESEERDSNPETEGLIENTLRRMSDHEVGISPSASLTSEENARQITVVTDPLTQQLAHLCELLEELRNEPAHRRHKETASLKAACSSTGNAGRSDPSVPNYPMS